MILQSEPQLNCPGKRSEQNFFKNNTGILNSAVTVTDSEEEASKGQGYPND